MPELLVEVTRGGSIESRHFGSAVVADRSGVRWSVGDADAVVFPRSAVKPVQALQLLESGAAERWGVTDAEVALACASHSGEPMHVDLARSWLTRLGLPVEALGCGAHWPFSEAAQRGMAVRGETPCDLHNNCSGKHVGFLCVAQTLGDPLEGYVEREHPIQQRWLEALAELAEVDLDASLAGVDGCAIPSQPLPLSALARVFAKFANPGQFSPARRAAVERMGRAIAANPLLIAGTGRGCSRIIAATHGRVLVKTGAEGGYVAWIPEAGIGVGLKIADGTTRASEIAIVGVIRKALGAGHELSARLAPLAQTELYTSPGKFAGVVRPAEALAV
jgi:L-asparaginase II